MEPQPEYAMLMQSLSTFRKSVGFHLMDETPLPDGVATPLWEAFHLICSDIEKLAVDHGCIETGYTIYAPSSSNSADDGSVS